MGSWFLPLPAPHIAVALKATALSLTAEGGTDYRPGVPPKQGKVRGSRRWGSWVRAHLGTCLPGDGEAGSHSPGITA